MLKRNDGQGLVARRCVAAASVGAILFGAIGLVINPAQAATQVDKIPLAISIGDSFISGEGGRFAGNIYDSRESDKAQDKGPHNKGNNSNVDAWGGHDFKETYTHDSEHEYIDGNQECHRSDSAEIQSTKKAFGWTPVNLACSGATSSDILKDWYLDEEPQVKQLAKLANDPKYDIKAVVVSIGGNDVGFSDLMSKLVQITDTNSPEDQSWKNKLNPFVKKKNIWEEYAENISEVSAKITTTLNTITDTMRSAGYEDDTYRFVYQSYTNLFAGSNNRYMAVDSKSQLKRLESPGVPLSNYTVDYSRSTMVPALTAMTREGWWVAKNKNIQFMNVTNAFEGHELSSKSTEQILAKQNKVPNPATAEWVVPINSNFIVGSIAKTSRHFESFHPNRFGQEAYGTCLVATIKSISRQMHCTGQADKPPSEIKTQTGSGGTIRGSFNMSLPASHELLGYYVPRI